MNHFSKKNIPVGTLLCCLSLLALTAATASAAIVNDNANVQVTAVASKNSVGVADPFRVTIKAVAPEGVVVSFPKIGDQAGDFEITNSRDTMDVPSPQGRKYERQLTLETLKTGELNVPEFQVFFKDKRNQNADAAMASMKTASIPITVQTAITATDNPSQFRDIKNVVFLDEPAVAGSLPWGTVIAIGGLGLLGVVGFVLVSRFGKRLTPKQRALRALDQLSDSNSLSSGDSKYVYEETTQVLRTFIESQFEFPATRQTTEEFLAAVNSNRRLGEPLQERLKRFLEAADMVKFAGLSCSGAVLAEAVDKARQFVLQADEQRIASEKQTRDNKFVVPPSGGIPAKAGTTNVGNSTNSSSLQKETV